MYNIEISNSIHKIFDIFFKLGLWDINDEANLFQTGHKLFYFIYFISVVASTAMCVCFSDEKDEFIFLTVASAIGLVQICRMGYILWKKNEILTIMNQIATHSIQFHNEFIRIDKKLKNMVTCIKNFCIVLFIAVGLFSFYPLVSSEKMLLLDMGFALDWKNSQTAYWVAFTYIEFGVFLSLICCLLIFIVWYLMINLAIKYEVLEEQFRSLGMIKTELEVSTVEQKNIRVLKSPRVSKTVQETWFLQDLITAIKAHQEINEKIYKFASTFSILFFLQIITSSICICGSVYNLTFSSHKDFLQDGLYCCIIIYSLFDVFVVMYFGNEIKLSSDRLSYCLYESNWIESTQQCKKYVIIFTEVLQHPKELIIAKIYPLNLDTFTTIVKLAYSMFNILQNLKLRN